MVSEELNFLLEDLGKNTLPSYKIYLDMDGVLTDFQGRFEKFTGSSPEEWFNNKKLEYSDKEAQKLFWKIIDVDVGEEFWSEMNWTPKGKYIWDLTKKYNPILLTSPSRNKVSKTGKLKWADKNLTPTPKVIFRESKKKKEFSDENSILIDDKPSNIEDWKNSGGIAIHHPTNSSDVSKIEIKLKKLGYDR